MRGCCLSMRGLLEGGKELCFVYLLLTKIYTRVVGCPELSFKVGNWKDTLCIKD